MKRLSRGIVAVTLLTGMVSVPTVLLAAGPASALDCQTHTAAVAGGQDYSVAAQSDGSVWAWGANQDSSLGDGTSTERTTPVRVVGLGSVTALAAGGLHTLALRSDGTVWAWGQNDQGQLGDGTTTNRSTPVRVTGLTGVTAIAAGAEHSLALRADGTVWAWGDDSWGELGDGGVPSMRATAAQITSLTGVIGIAAGWLHSLVVRADGTVWAFGYNAQGQLGDGTTTDRATPVQVSGLTGITAVAGGQLHSLALHGNGTVSAWGANNAGQLGDGTTTDRLTPVSVSGLSGVTAIAGGVGHSLGLHADGTVSAWGENINGELGDGTTTNRSTPVRVSVTGITAIATSWDHSLAISGNPVWAWGENFNGQLGDGTTVSRTAPVQVACTGSSTSVPFVAAPSGSAFLSDNCAPPMQDIVDGYVGSVYVRLAVKTVDPDTAWVCVRVDGGPSLNFGAQTIVDGTLGGSVIDTNSQACSAGSNPLGQHPLFGPLTVGDPVNATFSADIATAADGVSVCLTAGPVGERVFIPTGSHPAVAVNQDPAGHDPRTPVVVADPGSASGTCQHEVGATSLLALAVAGPQAWLSTASPAPGRTDLCVRAQNGTTGAGGMLTINSAAVPAVTTSTDLSPCTTLVVTNVNPVPFTVSRSPDGALPASVCVSIDGVGERVTVSSASPTALVSWQADS